MKAFRFTGDTLVLLDQTGLPTASTWLTLRTPDEVAEAIRHLRVRGAPAIGVVAAYALALAVDDGATLEVAQRALARAAGRLAAARPTAVNLAWALRQVTEDPSVLGADSALSLREAVVSRATLLEAEDVHLGEAIGRHGADLLEGIRTVITHCNTGALATAGPGTALSVLAERFRRHGDLEVWVDETRPLFQGARLTAYELGEAGIPYMIITEGAVGALLRRGEVQAAIVGADRIARNGDVANKIGTYNLAVLAHEHGVPFYVAAPFSTFDAELAEGDRIPIEERAPEEILEVHGVRLAPEGARAWNPAFDVTPSRLVSGYVTERGVFTAPLPDEVFKREGAKPIGS